MAGGRDGSVLADRLSRSRLVGRNRWMIFKYLRGEILTIIIMLYHREAQKKLQHFSKPTKLYAKRWYLYENKKNFLKNLL